MTLICYFRSKQNVYVRLLLLFNFRASLGFMPFTQRMLSSSSVSQFLFLSFLMQHCKIANLKIAEAVLLQRESKHEPFICQNFTIMGEVLELGKGNVCEVICSKGELECTCAKDLPRTSWDDHSTETLLVSNTLDEFLHGISSLLCPE